MLKKLQRRLRNVFITGLLITLPIALTYFILQFLFKNLDALSPVFTKVLIDLGAPIPEGYRIPALGLVITLLIVLTVGWFTTNFFGKRLIHLGEKIVGKIPFVRRIYKGSKQVVQSIAHADTRAFRKVVLIEFPRRGMLAIGFVTGEARGEVQEHTFEDVLNVFVPTMPNPTSGFLVFAPPEELTEIDMTIEDGVKYVVSGGIVTTEGLKIIEAKDIKIDQPTG
ncbi:MAG: putative membrane protein [Nitrospinales bacterium]